jgi:hypothetical protein
VSKAHKQMRRLLQWFRELFARIWARIKEPICKFLVFCFCLIGMISVLNWSIKVFAEAGEFYFNKEVSIVNQHNVAVVSKNEAVAPVVDGSVRESNSSMVSPLADIVEKIYQLESSSGKNVLCPEGKYNGYGYRQNKSEWVCYDNPEEPRQLVMNWFDKKLKEHTLNESLCLYNRGSLMNGECEYVDKFYSI